MVSSSPPAAAAHGRADSRTHPHRDSTNVMIAPMSYALGQGTGPLRGVKVVEIAGIGPGPHAA